MTNNVQILGLRTNDLVIYANCYAMLRKDKDLLCILLKVDHHKVHGNILSIGLFFGHIMNA